MKRIGIFCSTGLFSGKEVMTLELAEGLRERGYHLEMVGSFWGRGELPRRLRATGFSVHDLWLGFISATLRLDCLHDTFAQMLRWPQLLVGYRHFLRCTSPERLIHTNWQHLLLLLPLLKPERDFYWLHEMVPDKPQYRRVFGWLSQRLCCFVPVSRAVGESLRRINIPPEKIHVIHNGYGDPVPAGGTKPRQSGEIRVGIAGQMVAYKGHEDLLEAFAQVADKHPTAELHIFGAGSKDFENTLRRLAERLGIASRVLWRGYVPERATIYSDVDIFAVPSREPDPLPGVAVEAAFFGLPVVASRTGGLPEIIEDGVTGFLVEPRQPAEFASRLNILFNDAVRRKSMGMQARILAIKKFNRARFIQEFADLLKLPP